MTDNEQAPTAINTELSGKHLVDTRLVKDLIPYARNSRTHSDAQINQIVSSIKEFGFTTPVIIDENNGIIAGHGRIMAMEKMGEQVVPVVEVRGWTDAQKKAYVILDNKLPMNAEWDTAILSVELNDLEGMGFDLSLIGFDNDELSTLMEINLEDITGQTDEDAIPDTPETATTVSGDVWKLDDHRLMCGDSTSTSAIDKLMNGQKADFCFTSPPYGQQREYKNKISDWDEMMHGVYSILPVKEGAQVLVNLGLIHNKKEWQPYWESWINSMREMGWLRFALYVWDQGAGMMGDHSGRLAPSFELIFHFCKENIKAKKTAKSKLAGKISSSKGQRGKDGKVKPRTQAGKPIQDTKVRDSVIRINRQASIAKAGGHPAPFPVELCKELSNPWCKRGDICFEPFTGSGTQIINCEKEGYIFHGMELSPIYCDIAIERWQNFTGKDAIHIESGKTYNQLKVD